MGATLLAINAVAQALDEACEVIVVDDSSTDRTADIGREHGGEDAVGYPVMRAAIRAGSRAAIWLSERF